MFLGDDVEQGSQPAVARDEEEEAHAFPVAVEIPRRLVNDICSENRNLSKCESGALRPLET